MGFVADAAAKCEQHVKSIKYMYGLPYIYHARDTYI